MSSKNNYLEKTTVCKNCNSTQINNYCSECGQKIYAKRFTIKNFFFVFLDAFNIEKGFLFTLKMLFLKPGVIINDYIKGKTKSYLNPFKYLILISGIYAFLLISQNILDTSVKDTNDIIYKNSEVLKQAPRSEEAIQFQDRLMEKFKQYINLIPLLLIPFTSLISKWFYRSRNLFYGEHLIVNCYLFAQTFVITIIFSIPLIIFIPSIASYFPLISLATTIIYLSYGFYKTFKGSSVVSTIKAISIYFIGSIFFYLFLVIVAIILLIIFILLGFSMTDLL
jgi:hypothetical protein